MFSIRAAWKVGLGGVFSLLPRALSSLDGFLVNRVTFLFGTRWNGFRRAGLARWSHLTISLFGLALATALAPRPLAYAAAGLGLIGVLAIFRQVADLPRIAQAKGSGFSLWGQTAKCRRMGCPGKVTLHAQPPGAKITIVMT